MCHLIVIIQREIFTRFVRESKVAVNILSMIPQKIACVAIVFAACFAVIGTRAKKKGRGRREASSPLPRSSVFLQNRRYFARVQKFEDRLFSLFSAALKYVPHVKDSLIVESLAFVIKCVQKVYFFV